MLRTIFTLIVAGIAVSSFAQQPALADDQNPNFHISRDKYMQLKDSLLTVSNTTTQETYKAYDWFEAKAERRQERREQRRYNNSYLPYNNYWNSGYYPSYNYWDNGYRSRYNNRWSNWNIWPNIGFRTGNWWFSF